MAKCSFRSLVQYFKNELQLRCIKECPPQALNECFTHINIQKQTCARCLVALLEVHLWKKIVLTSGLNINLYCPLKTLKLANAKCLFHYPTTTCNCDSVTSKVKLQIATGIIPIIIDRFLYTLEELIETRIVKLFHINCLENNSCDSVKICWKDELRMIDSARPRLAVCKCLGKSSACTETHVYVKRVQMPLKLCLCMLKIMTLIL